MRSEAYMIQINLQVASPADCLVALSPECRLDAVRRLLILNATSPTHRRPRHPRRRSRDLVCHRAVNNTRAGDRSRLLYRCCAADDFRSGDDVTCRSYVGADGEMTAVRAEFHYTDPTGPARALSETRTDQRRFSEIRVVRVRAGPCSGI